MNWRIEKDKFVLLLMYFETVLFGFFGQTQNLNRIIVILIVLRLFSNYRRCVKDMPYIVLYSVLFALNIILGGGTTSVGIRNFLVLLYPLSQAYFVLYLCRYKIELLNKWFDDWFWLFNVTAVLNVAAAFVQCFNPGVITPVNTYDYSVMDVDNVTGFFSYGATHTFCLFMIFIIGYNLAYARKMRKGFKRNALITYTIGIIISISIISGMSDNKAFFVMLPVTMFVYYIIFNLRRNSFNAVIKSWGVLVAVIATFLILYNFNGAIKNVINIYFIDTLNKAQSAIRLGNSAYGSTERIAIIGYAFGLNSTWFLGTGFGSAMVFESGYMGFSHFGQADFGALMILGGIWITALIIVQYVRLFLAVSISEIKHNFVCRMSMFIFVLIVCIYTQCFTRTDVMLCLILLVISLQDNCDIYDNKHVFRQEQY